MTMTTDTPEVLRWLDDIAAKMLTGDGDGGAIAHALEQVPDGARALADAHVALALHGVRTALKRWHAVPAVTDPDEVQALHDLLTDLVITRVRDALASLQGVADTSAVRTQKALMDWNRERSVYDERALERAARAVMSEREPVDYDHFTTIRNDDGTFTPRYVILPSKDV